MSHTSGQAIADKIRDALSAGKTIQDAATIAGVSEDAVRRQWQDPKLRRWLRKERDASIDRATGALTSSFYEATSCLRELMKSESNEVRLEACRILLQACAEFRYLFASQGDSHAPNRRMPILQSEDHEQYNFNPY